MNKAVQVYLDTDYCIRDELRTESFPNTSHSQRAVTVIPHMSHVTLALGQSCWSTSSPGVNLNSRPVGQSARTLLGCQAATTASSTYAFFSKGISNGSSPICQFSQSLWKHNYLSLPNLSQLSPWTQKLPKAQRGNDAEQDCICFVFLKNRLKAQPFLTLV